jgi:hypothetical protein
MTRYLIALRKADLSIAETLTSDFSGRLKIPRFGGLLDSKSLWLRSTVKISRRVSSGYVVGHVE